MALNYSGPIPASKSVLNRALIVKSYFPVLDIEGDSNCDDVLHMKRALQNPMRERNRIHCGEGGTTFRFLALRTARYPGLHTLEGSVRLFQRPLGGLTKLLNQLGIQTQVKGQELFIVSEGWKKPSRCLQVDTTESSQYASALLLNAWLLNFDLEFELTGSRVSESYFNLTLDLVEKLGMRIKKNGNRFLIPSGQRISKLSWNVEPDLSSVFTVSAAAALAGDVEVTNFVPDSQQPDLISLQILKNMGVQLVVDQNNLKVSKCENLKAVEVDLSQSPDLFPVLAVLCSWAEGTSRLHSAPQLKFKESNRIEAVSRLFDLLQISYQALDDGMIIQGNPLQNLKKDLVFNPDQDHRMVMAAGLQKLKGHQIRIEEPHVINKSFPEFWDCLGLQP